MEENTNTDITAHNSRNDQNNNILSDQKLLQHSGNPYSQNTSNMYMSHQIPFQNNFSSWNSAPQNNKGSRNPIIFGCLFVFIVIILIGILCFTCMFITSLLGTVSTQNTGLVQSTLYSDVQIKEIPYKTSNETNNKIVIINIVGPIDYVGPTGEAFASGSVNDKIILAQIEQAKIDPNVKGVIFRFDSPGGVANVARPVCDAIKELNKEKLTYAYIDGTGASLAYWLPNCTSKIYASPGSLVGSIGVIATFVDFSKALDNLGIKVVEITNTVGIHKAQSDILDPNSEEYRKYRSVLDELYEEFLSAVYEGRKNNEKVKTKDYIKRYADGSIFPTKEALEIGLIDDMAPSVDAVAAKLAERKQIGAYSIVYYDIQGNPWAVFFSQLQTILPFLMGNKNVPSSRVIILLM